ncbi:helix-turn-helix transcriptional regulator [Radiobacillus deserti]|uniref:Tetratricopeptide repeat protein n=1 Tax=Radiobacillus deserti TaxID=2594883 RepID=A0A516KCP1_9BACI|nr:helix-turn-helix transcriptional regulator [Radiobacillus deserti]QDP39181.1 tetratricopeptide repeat protein [Radiobacillus deserti]
MYIGRRIRAERLKRGMLMSDLCNGLVSTSRLSNVENNLTNPSQSFLIAISTRLSLPGKYLLSFEVEDKEVFYLLNELFTNVILNVDAAKSLIELIDENYYEYLLSPKLEVYFLLLKSTYLLKTNHVKEAEELESTYLKVYLQDIEENQIPNYLKRAFYYFYGTLNYHYSLYESSLSYFSKLKDNTDDIRVKAAVTYNVSMILRKMERYHDAVALTLESIEYYENLEQEYDIALSYNLLGALYRRIKRYDKAQEALQVACAISERGHYKDLLSFVYHNTGLVARDNNDIETSIYNFQKALETKEQNQYTNILNAYCELIHCYLLDKQVETSLTMYEKASRLVHSKEDEHHLLYSFLDYYLLTNDEELYESNLERLCKYYACVKDHYYLKSCYI